MVFISMEDESKDRSDEIMISRQKIMIGKTTKKYK
jgi:hypothetical protein